MDETRKKARKRNNESESEPSSKKRRETDDLIQGEIEREVADRNTSPEKDDSMDITCNGWDEFNGKSLRSLLPSVDGLPALKKFVTICNENKERDLAAEYLHAGGGVLEILRLLTSSDKRNTADATTVFSAVNILLVRILAAYPQYQNSAIEACRHLLNSHISIVHSMLSAQSNTKQRKAVLRLLTAIVSLGGNLSRELLAHLSLQQQALECLVKPSKHPDPQSVRICFIHFLLAFFVGDNASVIRMLSVKRDLFFSIFPELIYDSKDLVTLVLTTMKMYVLENASISKTIKLHIFPTSVVLNLVSLYNWKGPYNWFKSKNQISHEDEEFLEDKKVVNDIVHEFLITLLTSHRHGIIFHDQMLGTSRNRHNQLVHSVLQSLEKPWEHEKPSDLVIKIMVACPDLIHSQYSAIESLLEPRVSPKWICLIKFVNKIVQSIDPATCIKVCSQGLTTNNLMNALLSLTIPSSVMKGAIIPGLDHDSLLVRHEVSTLLLTIIHQLKIISTTIQPFCIETPAIRNQMTDFILKTIPNLEMILRIWDRAFGIDSIDINTMALENMEKIQNPELLDHLDIVLNVLHSYKDVCPELLDNSMDLQLNKLLSRLDHLQNSSETDERMKKVNRMKIKMIQFLLALDSTSFKPREKIFKETLCFLISQIRRKASPESYDATRILLNTTGLFEACDDQVDIWINAFSVVDSGENEELMQWFLSILKITIKHTDKYTNRIVQAERTINERIANLDVKKAEDIINELFDKANENCNVLEDKSCVKKNNDIDKFTKENSKDSKYTSDKYMIHTNKRVTNMKKTKDIINELFDKANDNIYYDKEFFMPALSLTNRQFDLDVKGIDDTLINDTVELYKDSCVRMQVCTSVSPLLCCALWKASEKNYSAAIWSYLSYVMVHTMHHQVIPELLIYMAVNSTDLSVYKYLQSWSNDNQPISLKSKLPSLKLLQKISNILLTNTEMNIIDFSKLFTDGHLTCCIRYGEKEIKIKHYLSSYDVKALLKMTTFYLAQLAQREILQQTQNEHCKIILVFLLNIAHTYSIDQENMEIFNENVKFIFTHPILLHYFSPFSETSKHSIENIITQTILDICKVVVQLQEKYGSAKVYNIFSPFSDKLLIQLKDIMERNPMKVCNDNYDIAIVLLKVLPLRVQDVANLLLALMKLEKVVFVSNDKRNLSLFGHIVPILLDIFCEKEPRLSHNQLNTLDNQFVAKLSAHLVHLKSLEINVERWEETLVRYLSIFSYNIAGISTDTFTSLLTKGFNTSTIQLVKTLIAKNTKLIPSLEKYFLKTENAKQGDVVFSILASNLKYNWNERFLRNLYECHADDIIAYLTEPQNPVPWIERNITAVVCLIENTFELALCEKTCNNISQCGDKMDMVSIGFLQLLESLYKRYENLNTTVKEKPLTDLIQIFVYIMTLTLKKESKNIEKIKTLCEKLDNLMVRLREIKPDFIFSSLSKNYSWPQFTRFSLKLGLKDVKNDQTQSSILKILSNVCNIAYKDNTDDKNAKTLFEMATSHSEFVNIMLGSSKYKDDLVELLRILIRKDHSVMTISHIPLYLAAYNATLSHVDQRILQILQYYEDHGVKIQQYWPYLWGNVAAIRYSVKGEIDTALWRQPSIFETFNLFEKDIINETIKSYPVHRALKNNEELHDNSNVYDPAFYLPLLCSLLAENNVVACYKVNQSGALALALAACSSDSSEVRMAAYTIISRYYFHLEASKSKDKLLWMRLIDALRNGIATLKCPLKEVRLNCLVTTFLARASLVASRPLHPLYSPLHTFLMAKPALDLNTVPELLQLLHSSHVEHQIHRHWILENIRDGIKEQNDVDVALKCVLFKMLLDFHTCTLPDTKAKKLILEIISCTTRIPKASLCLMQGYGMLSWLHETVAHLDIYDAEIDTIINIIITIIENLLNSLDISMEYTIDYKLLLLNVLLHLRAHFSRNNNLLVRYVNVFQRIISVIKDTNDPVSEGRIKKVL